jgi:hypothetical protein
VANVDAEEKQVLAAVEVQRSHPVMESSKSIRIKGQIVKSYEAVANIIAATNTSKVLKQNAC